MMKQSSPKMQIQTAGYRSEIIATIRRFFSIRGVLEVETPILSHGCPTDCHIDVFRSEYYNTAESAPSETVYLQTSPEFHMKRLLAQGYPDIYQICKTFRNTERGRIHNPEFTMLEWYRRGFSMMQLIDEVAELAQTVLGSKKVVKKSYQSLFLDLLQPDPLTATVEDLIAWCKKQDYTIPVNHTKTDILGFLMAQYIEPHLPDNCLVFVFDYPIEQAVFAVPSPDDPRVARRFELYFNGIELCNGFEELADWEENQRRMHHENEKRIAMGKAALPGDPHFIHALKEGIPNCSGVAVGLDRLIMLGAGSQCIDEILTFPWEIA